jgi:hypothetical protein
LQNHFVAKKKKRPRACLGLACAVAKQLLSLSLSIALIGSGVPRAQHLVTAGEKKIHTPKKKKKKTHTRKQGEL